MRRLAVNSRQRRVIPTGWLLLHLAGALVCLAGAVTVLWLVFFRFGVTDATDTGVYDSYINGRYADTIELPIDQNTAVGQGVASFLAAPLLVVAAGLIRGVTTGDYNVVKIGGGILAGSAALIMPLMYLYQEEGLSLALDPAVTVSIPFVITAAVFGYLAWARTSLRGR